MACLLLLQVIMMNMIRLFTLTVFFLLPAIAKAGFSPVQTGPQPLKTAWNALKANSPLDAIKELSQYRPDKGSLAAYHYIYGSALYANKDFQGAIEHFRQSYNHSPEGGEIKELSLLGVGEAYLGMRYYYEAKSSLTVFIKNFPNSGYSEKAHGGLAASLSGIGTYEEAIGHYVKAGLTPEAAFGKANAMQRLGMTKEADGAYRKALSDYPSYIQGSNETLYLLGQNSRLSGRTGDARKYLSAVNIQPFKGDAEDALGVIEMAEQNTEAAANHFGSALLSADRRTKRRALLHLAEARTKLGTIKEAREGLEELRRGYPYTSEYDAATLMLSRFYGSEGNSDVSVRLLKELLFRRPPSREALHEFETLLRDAERKKETVRLADLWKSAGQWLLDNTREKFLLDIAAALRSADGPSLKIYLWLAKNGSQQTRDLSLAALAEFHAETGNTTAAREYLRKITGRSRSDDTLRLEAKIFYAEGNLRAAAEKTLALKTIGQDDLKILGAALTSAPDFKTALARYELALRETGGNPEAYIRLADVFYDLGKMAEALKGYRLVLAKEPENQWALYRAARLSSAEEAEELFKKVVKGSPALNNSASAGLKEIAISKKMENF